MNKTPAETTALINEMKPLVAGADCKVVLCVPYVDIPAAVAASEGSNIEIGAENVHFKESGAYTGEISAQMLVESGVKYVVIGHSERRQYFGETDQTVNLRTLAAVNAGLTAIVCVGETLEQRELGYTETLLKFQTKMALTNVTAEQMTGMTRPIEIDGKTTSPAEVRKAAFNGFETALEVTIHDGRNRQVRRMCEAAGMHCTRLRRIREGSLSLGELPLGKWRYLTAQEVEALK